MTSTTRSPTDESSSSRATRVAGVEEIRAHFPALDRAHHGRSVSYFDGPGGTQVPRSVVEAINDYLYNHNANTHWNYPSSAETDAAIEGAREAAADFVNASASEMSFGNNMTTITFHLARALGRQWNAGDELVVTELDHHANVAPWRDVARERGLTVRTVPFHVETGELDWDALERSLSGKTRLLAIGAASNALGTITDIRRASDLAHAAGALVFADAVHFAAHGEIDVRAMDCDFLSCSSYKFYGPHAGLLFGKAGLLQGLDVPKLEPAPDAIPERLETGTQNHEGMIGTGAAIDFLAGLSEHGTRRERLTHTMRALHTRGTVLVRRLWEGLSEIRGVTCYGPPPGRPRTPTVVFTVAGVTSDDVARALAERAIFASHGDFYATSVIERLGCTADGVVRAGCACYTTLDEVELLLGAVAEIAN